MSDVLITGATGLIGRSVLPLLAGRHRAWALSRTVPLSGDQSCTWIRHDLTDSRLPDTMPGTIDSVIHLAQSPYFREFPERAPHVFEVSVGSTMRLLHWARQAGARRFVYASSGGIYGHGDEGFREDDLIRPQGPLGFYFAAKQCGESLVENYADHLIVIVLRFFFVYGRHQRPDMLIPRLVRSVRAEDSITLQGEQGMRLNPIHVSDAARCVVKSLALTESHKINIAGEEILTMREIGDAIGHHLGKKPSYRIQQGQPAKHLIGDIQKMQRLLDHPIVTFHDGVKELCEAEAQPRAR
ncbi:MAG: UDP-glucose 4-epimerase [Nitrospira sp.]|nr:MAG: UDP-glucose 4-epimerase [Nitrospira sp.]